jgi:hypothetical protein
VVGCPFEWRVRESYGDEVECVKLCKLIMGSGKAIPSEPTLARSPRQASEVGGDDVASIPFGGPERARADIAEPPLRLPFKLPALLGIIGFTTPTEPSDGEGRFGLFQILLDSHKRTRTPGC